MERFVRYVLAGGFALVAGLWVTDLLAWGTPAWAGGVALALLGCVALSAGIWSELDV